MAAWNAWRVENPEVQMDLSEANLGGADLRGVNLREANLTEANLSRADLSGANLSGANLWRANLRVAYLMKADLSGADLSEANLGGADLRAANLNKAIVSWANLIGANLNDASLTGAGLYGTDFTHATLCWADLRGANLVWATLVDADLRCADLTGCRVYGVSAWNLKLEKVRQQDLVITPENEPKITVDNIEVAQFVYLLLKNQKIRDIIDTIGRKGVLLLGRFTKGRIEILERLRLIGAGGRCKTVVDAEIAAFRPSAPFQSVPKTRKPSLILWIVLREAGQHADASSLIGLLRFRRERPRRRCAANKRDELATPHGLALRPTAGPYHTPDRKYRVVHHSKFDG